MLGFQTLVIGIFSNLLQMLTLRGAILKLRYINDTLRPHQSRKDYKNRLLKTKDIQSQNEHLFLILASLSW